MVVGAIMQSGGGYPNGLSKGKTVEEAYRVGNKVLELLGVSYARELRNLPADKFVEILPKLYEEMGYLCFGPVVDQWVLEEDLNVCVEKNKIHPIPLIIGSNANDIAIPEGGLAKDGPLYKGAIGLALARVEFTSQPTYVYYFSRKLPGEDGAGAFHSCELWYMFGTLERCWRPMERRDYILSRTMIDEWTNFFKTGNPGGGWQAYTEKGEFLRRYI